MYEIQEFKTLSYPHTVRMSFELPYLDWCRFEKSELFRDLTDYFKELQKQNIPLIKKTRLPRTKSVFNGREERKMYKENIFKISPEERQSLLDEMSAKDHELFDVHNQIQHADIEIGIAVDWVITKLGEFIGSYDFIEENSLPNAPWKEMLRLLFRIRLSHQYIEESLDEMWKLFKKRRESLI